MPFEDAVVAVELVDAADAVVAAAVDGSIVGGVVDCCCWCLLCVVLDICCGRWTGRFDDFSSASHVCGAVQSAGFAALRGLEMPRLSDADGC